MREETGFATGAWYHVMSFDITQSHDRTVPELSQVISLCAPAASADERGVAVLRTAAYASRCDAGLLRADGLDRLRGGRNLGGTP